MHPHLIALYHQCKGELPVHSNALPNAALTRYEMPQKGKPALFFFFIHSPTVRISELFPFRFSYVLFFSIRRKVVHFCKRKPMHPPDNLYANIKGDESKVGYSTERAHKVALNGGSEERTCIFYANRYEKATPFWGCWCCRNGDCLNMKATVQLSVVSISGVT